jgi:hypothetical protein
LTTQGEGKHETLALTCKLLPLPKQFSASLLLPALRSEFHFFYAGNPIAGLPSFGKGHADTSIGQELCCQSTQKNRLIIHPELKLKLHSSFHPFQRQREQAF